MNCPYCNNEDTNVLESRGLPGSEGVRRRRQCKKCGKRFTTHEKLVNVDLKVIKKNGKIEQYDRDKLLKGVIKACYKRKVSKRKEAEMPFDQYIEEIRPQLVAAWNEKQAMNRRQISQFMSIIQPAVDAYLRKADFQDIIMRVLGKRRGRFSATKLSGSTPLDGELLEGHVASYSIDPCTAGFNGKDNVPGFRNQLIGPAGDGSIFVIVSSCRDQDTLYHVTHVIYEEPYFHQQAHLFLDSRRPDADFETWLTVALDFFVGTVKTAEEYGLKEDPCYWLLR